VSYCLKLIILICIHTIWYNPVVIKCTDIVTNNPKIKNQESLHADLDLASVFFTQKQKQLSTISLSNFVLYWIIGICFDLLHIILQNVNKVIMIKTVSIKCQEENCNLSLNL